jgi:hypothetical protein
LSERDLLSGAAHDSPPSTLQQSTRLRESQLADHVFLDGKREPAFNVLRITDGGCTSQILMNCNHTPEWLKLSIVDYSRQPAAAEFAGRHDRGFAFSRNVIREERLRALRSIFDTGHRNECDGGNLKRFTEEF